MKTKTSILAALIAMAGSASLMAQNVYSLNVVGYINQSIPSGFSMVANQLNAADLKVATIMSAPPEGTSIYKFNPSTGAYVILSFIDGAWEGDDVNMTLGPGEGAFILAPSAFTNTFVGEVKLGSTNVIEGGFSIMSSAVPQSGPIDSLLGFPAAEGDTIYRFNPVSGAYIADSFIDGAWEGDSGGSAPTPNVGEAFWVLNPGTDKNWERNFNPNN